MNEKKKKKISKFLSLVLRHKLDVIGIKLDEKGWVKVDILRKACAENSRNFTKSELKEVVATNDKKRFSFNEDETKIRANQGHSIDIELELKEKTPPKTLYHELTYRCGSESSLRRKPIKLSRGMSQRLVLACALVNEPQILLADEPTPN